MLRFAASFAPFFFLLGCGGVGSPPISVPDSATEHPSLAGSYVFESVESCVRREGDDVARETLLPVDRIAPGTLVDLELDGDRLLFHYTDLAGGRTTASVPLDGAVWEGSRLVLRPGASPAYPGVAGGSRSCSIYRAKDGRLVVTDRQVQTGLALFLVPFRDREETVVIMEPARGAVQ